MVNANLLLPKLDRPKYVMFKRRESLPLAESSLWRIETGAVRSFTLAEDGTVISLGFWGSGDLVGQPLVRIQPYQMECLTDVEACLTKPGECCYLHQAMLAHIHQTQELLRIRNGPIHQRLQQFLNWIMRKFGRQSEMGQLIQLRLTHQDIADVLGTTRVTVTRLLGQMEQEGAISRAGKNCILIRHHL
jgi:CRP-like cAMP-binding protein